MPITKLYVMKFCAASSYFLPLTVLPEQLVFDYLQYMPFHVVTDQIFFITFLLICTTVIPCDPISSTKRTKQGWLNFVNFV